MSKEGMEIGVACVQMEPRIGAVEENIANSVVMASEAADRGAELIVLPELCNSGYVFESEEEALSLAEDAYSGPAVRAWTALAKARQVWLVAGLNERARRRIYNSAVVVGPEGVIGVFRKIHLWDTENRFFAQGDLGFPVFDLPFGRLGVFICYDGWFPESYRMCALKGADILCVPTNWVPMPDQPPERDVMANTLVMGGAHANAVFIAASDRIGIERGQPFLGRSLIVGPAGWPLAGPASADREEILLARVNLAEAARRRQLNARNHLFGDRRTDVYGEMIAQEEATASR
ncbi:MAG TPA: nitrilase family protein [Acetobacteraceae bacterium]|nr:nitrilase family protein [Acetobacteraceae bacterium]